jgi:beta-glucanase (GH16 family)
MHTLDLSRRRDTRLGPLVAAAGAALAAAVIVAALVVAAVVGGTVGAATPHSTTATVAPAPQVAASEPCQGTRPLGLPGAWKCTFDDEFNGNTLNTRLWVPQLTANSAYVAGSDCYVNSPSTVSVSGGHLNLSVRRVPAFTCADPAGNFTSHYEAGMVSTYGLFNQTYGAFEVHAKLPPATVSGLQETFWLYPQTLSYGGWPYSGEIDFAEFYSQYWGLDVPFIHYAQSSGDPNATAYTCALDQNSFNTYGVDWTPTTITVLYNGEICNVDHPVTGGAPFNEPFFIALTQALGIGTNAASAAAPPTAATTQVDWVRAWSAS